MRERPILFNDEMVRAILAGLKDRTRRPVVPKPPTVEAVRAKAGIDFSIFTDHHAPDEFRVGGPVWAVRELMDRDPRWRCPFGAPGDLLWLRECWAPAYTYGGDYPCVVYRADMTGWIGSATHPVALVRAGHYGLVTGDPDATASDNTRWRPSIHMPRWASRLTLRVTDVRVERVQDITEEDARAEGVRPHEYRNWNLDTGQAEMTPFYRSGFAELWDRIYESKGLGWDVNPWVWVVGFEPVEDSDA